MNERYAGIIDIVREVHPNATLTLIGKDNRCRHITTTGHSAELEWRGVKRCMHCGLTTVPPKPPSKFSWRSIKDWFRAWWRRNVVDDYENLW
jgi:hypothetical protein